MDSHPSDDFNSGCSLPVKEGMNDEDGVCGVAVLSKVRVIWTDGVGVACSVAFARMIPAIIITQIKRITRIRFMCTFLEIINNLDTAK
jgi:hypothetical protein